MDGSIGRRKIPAVRGAAAFGRPWGPLGPTACQTKEQGPGPLAPGSALSGRFASRRRPLRYGPHQRQKGNGKARPHDLWGLAHKTLAERGTATAPSPRQSRCPCPTGSGGFIRPAAGYGLRPPAPAVARFSPPAKGRRPRRAAARVGPPSAQGSYRTAHSPLPRGVRSAILINNQYYEMRFTI